MRSMTDLQTTDDVKLLVDEFYGKVREDDLLDPIFNGFAHVDWAAHLPKMYAFWNAMILGIQGYAGRPFPPHVPLPVSREHFQRWVGLFHATVDEHFAGENAQRAKDVASSIAHTFALRLGVIDPMAGQLL